MHSQELNDILDKCKRQDRAAQFQLYRQYSKAMYNVCLRMMKNEGDAEDVLQEAFIKAFSHLHSYKQEATFGAWLKRIVINTCISQLKKNKMFFQEIDEKDFVSQPEENVDLTLDINRVKWAIKELPEGYNLIFTMYTLEGYNHQEIGEILNISVSTSKSQYSRAKAKIRELLSDEDRVSKVS